MTNTVLVLGHRNPDNDSISAAIGHAYLRTKLAERDGNPDGLVYLPGRLGPLPPESKWVLERNGIDEPMLVPHVHVRVKDVMTENPVSVTADETMLEAGRLLRKLNVRSLVVRDLDGKFLGLISTRAIAERYISATDMLQEGEESSSMAVATSLIDSLTQKVGELMATNVLILDGEDLVKDAAADLIASELREGVVLDSAGRAIGIVTRSDVTNAPKRKVILVDHNESRQAAPGIEGADVLEIIDHHRIADVSTANPIRFLNLPWGSTATIVTYELRKEGFDIPRGIAEVLLSAILTDTVILKSPTTTEIDKDNASYLCDLLGVELRDFGLQVFRARGGEESISVEKFVEADSKEFLVNDNVVLIAQHETVDLEAALSREEEIRAHMCKLLNDKKYDFVLLLVTDILSEGSQFLLEGNPKIVNNSFGIDIDQQGGVWMPGILSRKKQVAARILS